MTDVNALIGAWCYDGLMAGMAVFCLARGTPPSDVAGESCGACGYPRLGLPSPVCPECGADSRQVPPAIRRPAKYSLWTLLPYGIPLMVYVPLWILGIVAAMQLGHWPRPYIDDSGPNLLNLCAFVGVALLFPVSHLVLPMYWFCHRARGGRRADFGLLAFALMSIAVWGLVWWDPGNLLEWLHD